MIEAIKKHAKQEYPRECCGVVIIEKGREKYIPCRNILGGHDFAIDPVDFAKAEDRGEIIKIIHSHPNQSPMPSEADRISCEKSGLKWLIMSYPSGDIFEFEPTGYEIPLLGRQFAHGIVDCYSFIQDYYRVNLNINLPDFVRKDDWWLGGEDLYMEGFNDAGFSVVSDMEKHDVLLMKVMSPVLNHGAVYVGDGNIEHHQHGRLSSRDVYGGWHQKITQLILRYEDL